LCRSADDIPEGRCEFFSGKNRVEKFEMGKGGFCKEDITSTIPVCATVSVND